MTEYITQLEAEISGKVSENSELRVHNRALADENKRLTDLTRMLLASPSFSDLLNQMSTNPAPAPVPQQQQAEPQVQEQQQRRQPKDVNPYNAGMQGQGQQQQQIGMTMIPEQNVDFSNLNIEGEQGFLQPQVFAMEAPELTGIDASVLSGKASNFVEGGAFEEEKVQMPVIERAVGKGLREVSGAPVDPAFEADPEFELYHESPARSAEESTLNEDARERSVFGGIRAEKVLARYELVDAAAEEQCAIVAMERVARMCERLEGTRLR
ncbi:hypothetical protein IMZ48_14750, partial [Candidatus Bathyarchaeota archaeon]|nr:hypothetical protein [Candidatus Bathyarchaeota archaeon]